MKYVTALAGILFSSIVYAGGALTIDYGPRFTGDAPMEPVIALNVIEPLDSRYKWTYESWTGFKVNYWLTSSHYLVSRVTDRLRLGVGPTYDNYQGADSLMLKIRAEYLLWR